MHTINARLLGCLVFVSVFVAAKTDSTRTKSGLKEDIGHQIKLSIDECLNIQEKLAQTGHQICKKQRKLIKQMEELLENGPEFKGKNKTELETTLASLTKETTTLCGCANRIDTISS